MKRFLLILIIICGTLTATAQNELFKKYEDKPGVTTVFISKAMINSFPDMEVGDQRLGRLAKKLDMVRILDCERPSMVRQIRDAAFAALKQGQFQLMMQTTDDGEKTYIYHRQLQNGKSEYTLLNVDHDEIDIINVIGTVTLSDIKKMGD